MTKVFEVFANEYVSVVVKGARGQKNSKVANLVLTGYLVDECDECYYMGEGTSINACIKKSDVSVIMIASDEEAEFVADSEIQ